MAGAVGARAALPGIGGRGVGPRRAGAGASAGAGPGSGSAALGRTPPGRAPPVRGGASPPGGRLGTPARLDLFPGWSCSTP